MLYLGKILEYIFQTFFAKNFSNRDVDKYNKNFLSGL